MIGDTEADFTYGDCREEMDRFNRIFTEIMIEGDGKGKPFTFPIVTYSITDKFPWGSDLSKAIFTFADECNSPYFSNFINSDNDPSDVRSMCPLTPDTEVFVKTEIGGITKRTIGKIYSNVEAKGTRYQVWNPSSGWVDGRPIQIPATNVYEVTMSNGEKVKMGENHLQPIRGGEVLHADELKVGMWLPFHKEKMGYFYYSITDIQEVKPTSEYLYCFEVDCEDRLFTLANGLITHNCRLRLDLTQLINSGGGLFGSGDKTGSLGVVTINLPRLAYIAKHTKEDALYDFPVILKGEPVNDYFTLLDYFAGLARESLLIKRKVVNKSLDAGLMTYTKRYLGNFDKHFNTIGVNGGHEACLNLLGQGIDSEQGKSLMTKTLNTLLDLCRDWQVEDKTLLWNLEATPAEGASTRFARLDKRQFRDIITGGGDGDFYTNSTQLPDDYTDNIFEVFKHQNDLQPLYTSGTVQHIYLNEPTHDWEAIENLVGKLFTNFKLPYLSISPDITVCPICGRLDGYYEYCPNEHTEEQIREALERGIITEDDIKR